MALTKASKKNLILGIGVILVAFAIAFLLWQFLYGEITMGPQKRGLVNTFLLIPWLPSTLLYAFYYWRRQKALSSVTSTRRKDPRLTYIVISSVFIVAALMVPMVAFGLVAAAPFFAAMAVLLLASTIISYLILIPK